MLLENRYHQNIFYRVLEIHRKKQKTFLKKYDKQVRTSTGGLLKKKEIPRDKKGKQVRSYADVVSTGKLSKEREK